MEHSIKTVFHSFAKTIVWMMFLLSEILLVYEFLNIVVWREVEDYPWGSEEAGWNYESPQLYAKSIVFYFVCFLPLVIYGTYHLFKSGRIPSKPFWLTFLSTLVFLNFLTSWTRILESLLK